MSIRHGVFALVGLCAVVVVFSFFGLISDFVTRLLTSVDGLLLLMISGLMAGIFSLMIFVLAKESGLLPAHHKSAQTGNAPAGGEKPRQPETAGVGR